MIDDELRAALHAAAPSVAVPDAAPVRARAARRRRRRAVARAATGVVAVLAALVAGTLLVGREGTGGTPAATSTAPAPTALTCPLPFAPDLPTGWRVADAVVSSAPGELGAVWWSPEGGPIEVYVGIGREGPSFVAPPSPVTVLGHPGSLGPISDGDAIVVELGTGPCDRWAFLSHPGVTQEQLVQVVTSLRPLTGTRSIPTPGASTTGP